jgi:hypothetical protein
MLSRVAFILTASIVASLFHAAPAVADDGRMRTVVMGIAARRGVDDKTLVAALSSVVLSTYAKDGVRIVIGPEDITRALEWEASRQQAGCDDSACLAEVGAAMDAARIVNGTLDAVGNVYLLSLSEIDAKTLEPVGRVQREVEKDEAALLDATRELAGELLRQSGTSLSGIANSGPFSGNAGSIEIASDPNGAKIIVGNAVVGETPTKIDNIRPGRHMVRLTRNDYESVEFEVPVHAGGSTRVKAELMLLRSIAEKNIEVRNARWRDDDQFNQIAGWSKIGVGTVGALIGAALILPAIGGDGGGDGAVITGLVVGAAGAGILAWGVIDLSTPPARPVPEWEIERKVTVTPPKEKGEAEVRVLQDGRGPTSR